MKTDADTNLSEVFVNCNKRGAGGGGGRKKTVNIGNMTTTGLEPTTT